GVSSASSNGRVVKLHGLNALRTPAWLTSWENFMGSIWRRPLVAGSIDFKVWKCFLQLADPLFGHMGVADVQVFEPRKPGEMEQSGIANLSAVEPQTFEPRMIGEQNQPIVGHLGVVEEQPFEFR